MNEPTSSITLGSTRPQHEKLVQQTAVVLRLGMMLMASGASAYRVKSSMSRLARSVGLDEHHAQVSFTEISTTAYADGFYRTEIAEQRTVGINAHRIDALGDFVSTLPASITAREANEALTRIESMPRLYKPWLLALIAGIACAAFAFLNRGGALECTVVFVAACAGQFLRSTLLHRHINHMAVWVMCGLLSAGLYIAVVTALENAALINSEHIVGFISSTLYLVPGFPLVTGMLDLARMDLSAGISRLTYVMLLLMSASFSIWLLSFVFGVPLAIAPPSTLPLALLLILQVLASFCAAFGFAMLFNATTLACTWAGVIAAIVNPTRIWATGLGLAPQLSVALAAFTAGLLAELIAPLHKRQISRVSLSVPAVVTMVPGVLFYVSMAHFSNGDVTAALGGAVQVLLIFGAIGIGLAAARLLMDKNWLYDRDTQKLSVFGDEYHMR